MSLRLRLLLATGLVALVALVAADLVTFSSLRSYLDGQLDRSLDAVSARVATCLEAGVVPNAVLMENNAPGLFLEERTVTGRVIGRVRARELSEGGRALAPPSLPATVEGLEVHKGGSTPLDGDESCGPHDPPKRTEASGHVASASPPDLRAPPAKQDAVYFTAPSSERGGSGYRVRASALSNGRVMLIGVALEPTTATLNRLVLIEIAVTAGALVVACALGWWLVHLGMRPLAQVERTAEAIERGDLAARVPEASAPSTEIGRLARVLNTMLGTIEGAFEARDRTERALRSSEDRMRRFLGDASHELRTPLAAISAYAELYERGAGEHPEDTPRILESIRLEAGRMGRLVSDLLLLANLDEGRPLVLQPVELVQLAARAVRASQLVGPGWPMTLRAVQPVEVLGDEVRLAQVLDNLLTNARSYTPEGTTVEVQVSSEGTEAIVAVADHGPGFGAAGLERAFERFYRAEGSRSRTEGGSGLGLAIVKAIVLAHNGSVSASETPGGGATISLRLPRAESNPEDAPRYDSQA